MAGRISSLAMGEDKGKGSRTVHADREEKER